MTQYPIDSISVSIRNGEKPQSLIITRAIRLENGEFILPCITCGTQIKSELGKDPVLFMIHSHDTFYCQVQEFFCSQQCADKFVAMMEQDNTLSGYRLAAVLDDAVRGFVK